MMCKLLSGLVPILFFASSYAIYRGQDAVIEDYPFMASFQVEYFGNRCGAIILSPRWLLSSADCPDVWNYTLYTPRISAGSTSLSDDGAQNNQTIFVNRYVMHPNYGMGDIDPYNVGLVRLVKPLVFGDTIKTATIAPPGTEVRENATFIGWGETDRSNWEPSAILQSISLPVLTSEECQGFIGGDFAPGSAYCTGPLFEEDLQVGPCFKDKGGPLIQDGQILGIFIYTEKCAKNPAVFLKLDNFTDWIQETIKDE